MASLAATLREASGHAFAFDLARPRVFASHLLNLCQVTGCPPPAPEVLTRTSPKVGSKLRPKPRHDQAGHPLVIAALARRSILRRLIPNSAANCFLHAPRTSSPCGVSDWPMAGRSCQGSRRRRPSRLLCRGADSTGRARCPSMSSPRPRKPAPGCWSPTCRACSVLPTSKRRTCDGEAESPVDHWSGRRLAGRLSRPALGGPEPGGRVAQGTRRLARPDRPWPARALPDLLPGLRSGIGRRHR